MMLEKFISARYLISKHKLNFISIISIISILGITIGVAALITVLSVFNGFSSLVSSLLMSLNPHIRIDVVEESGFNKIKTIFPILSKFKEIEYISEYVTGKTLAVDENGQNLKVINLKGIEPVAGERLYGIQDAIILGEYNLKPIDGITQAVVGINLADQMQIFIGDTITLISPSNIEQVVAQLSAPASQKFIVSGIFRSDNNEYDASYIFTDIDPAKRLLGYGNNFQGYEIKLKNLNNADKVKEYLSKRIDSQSVAVSTWYDFHRELYSVMKIERWVAYLILSLIIAVASFNILSSLTMSVIEKRRDIGILRSMGVEQKSILKIFMFEGLLLGAVGTAAGIILGYLICYIQINYNIYPLDPTQYKIDSLPMDFRLSDFFYVGGGSMLLSFLASLYPAKRAAKESIIEAIKWE